MVGDIKVFPHRQHKIRNELGLEFLTDFRKGLEMTVEWARDYFAAGRGSVYKNHRIGVVVPAYNEELLLPETLAECPRTSIKFSS